MDEATRRRLVAAYREGPDVVEAAVSRLSDEELDRRPPDGGWTAREVVNHLADSEMLSSNRLARLLAEDDAVIQGYDEEAFARCLHYASRPVEPALAALRAARESVGTLLEHLTEEDWRRAGTHSESGTYSVETWLEIYGRHAHDHAEQIRAAAGRAGP